MSINNPNLLSLRRELHQYPELSGREFETAKRIRKYIEQNNPTEIIDNIGDTGVAAVYKYSDTGLTITIRCELDALPIQEVNNFDYQSVYDGVSHKCGHDGHMTIVAGLSDWLKNQNFRFGKVVLLFQPAEETGKGAAKVAQDEKFQSLHTDFIFALHNIPGESLHRIISMDSGFSAEVISFSLILQGIESHAAEPENGINPAKAISELITAFDKLNNNKPTDKDFAVLTPVHINMGQKSYGVFSSKWRITLYH